MKDGRSKTSAENGKKGGRPKGYAALQAEQSRIMLCEQLEKNWLPIVKKAIEQAKSGDKAAREWLADRGYGRVPQSLTLEGNPEKPIPITKI